MNSNNSNIISKNFTSIDKDHEISTRVIDDIAWFQIEKVNFEKFKTFILLIKDCVDYFRMNNIQYIKQYISYNDTEFFKQSEISNIDSEIYTVTTPISNFIDELVCVLGIRTI